MSYIVATALGLATDQQPDPFSVMLYTVEEINRAIAEGKIVKTNWTGANRICTARSTSDGGIEVQISLSQKNLIPTNHWMRVGDGSFEARTIYYAKTPAEQHEIAKQICDAPRIVGEDFGSFLIRTNKGH